MKKTFLLFLAVLAFTLCKAQYVPIDSSLAAALIKYGFTCVSGANMLDTTAASVKTTTWINFQNYVIKGTYGIQYFRNLDSLNFENCYSDACECKPYAKYLYSPAHLKTFRCGGSQVDSLGPLPSGLTILDISSTGI